MQVAHTDRTTPVTARFKLKNPTARPIRIDEVRSPCRCTTSSIAGRTIDPGEVAEFELVVSSFDTYSDRFAERATLRASDGRELDYWVTGSLPPAARPLCFPRSLHLQPDATGEYPTRSVRLRVPAPHARPASSVEFAATGVGSHPAVVIDAQEVGAYREFVIRLDVVPTTSSPDSNGTLRIDAGCAPVEIPILFAPRRVEEG